MANPRPLPGREVSPRQKRPVARSLSWSPSPGPWSMTTSRCVIASASTMTSTVLPCGAIAIELSSRLSRICSIAPGTAATTIGGGVGPLRELDPRAIGNCAPRWSTWCSRVRVTQRASSACSSAAVGIGSTGVLAYLEGGGFSGIAFVRDDSSVLMTADLADIELRPMGGVR